MPFKSQAQRRFMYATMPTKAKEWEKETPKKKLPEKVDKPHAEKYSSKEMRKHEAKESKAHEARETKAQERAEHKRYAQKSGKKK